MARELTADLLMTAYAAGVFPMSESRHDDEIFWVDPRNRGIIPLDGFRISRSLAKVLRQERFAVTVNEDFAGVLEGCADREETWINGPIARLYTELHRSGRAHSLEVRREGRLMGGVYGVVQGGAFFGESMFSRSRDASKVALAHLVDRLRRGGFTLFDTQFLTPHLASLGGIEVPRAQYRAMLARALAVNADFLGPGPATGQEVMQRSAQTS